jgi:hypothetical protein
MSGLIKFTLAGNKLTFIAKAFEAGSDNTYRVKIKATVDVAIVFGTLPLETEKTITVTVTKTNFNDGKLHITTADVSTPENTDKTIELTLNQYNRIGITSGFRSRGYES